MLYLYRSKGRAQHSKGISGRAWHYRTYVAPAPAPHFVCCFAYNPMEESAMRKMFKSRDRP